MTDLIRQAGLSDKPLVIVRKEQSATIKARLFALMDLLLEDSKFDKMTQNIIRSLAKNFIGGNVTDDDLRAQIVNVRDEIIPLILGEEPTKENQP